MMRFAAVALLASVASAKTTFVEELDSKNYDFFLGEAKADKQWVLVEFYAPWCAHCKRMAPILEEFAESHMSVRVGKVDATKHGSLAKEHKVDGYPTLRWRDAIKGASFREYRGGRDLDSLESLDTRLNAPAITHVASPEELAELCSLKPKVAFVALEGWLTDDELTVFERVAAHRHHEASFAVATKAALGPLDDLAASSSGVAVVQPGEPPFFFDLNTFNKVKGLLPASSSEDSSNRRVDKKAMTDWVKKHNIPGYSYLGPGNFRAIGKMRLVAVAVVADPDADRSGNFSGFSSTLYDVARTAPSLTRETFGFGELDGARWAEYVKTMGVKQSDLPRLLVIDLANDRFWTTQSEAAKALLLLFSPESRPAPTKDEFAAGEAPSAKNSDASLTVEDVVRLLDAISEGTLKPTYHGWRGFRDRVLDLPSWVLACYFGSAILLVVGIVYYFKLATSLFVNNDLQKKED